MSLQSPRKVETRDALIDVRYETLGTYIFSSSGPETTSNGRGLIDGFKIRGLNDLLLAEGSEDLRAVKIALIGDSIDSKCRFGVPLGIDRKLRGVGRKQERSISRDQRFCFHYAERLSMPGKTR